MPLVWVVPIVAVAAAGWLGYNALSERGPLISITLQTADGIEPGRTRVRHKQVELGVVQDLVPSADLSHVTLYVRMNRYADGHLNAGTQFWVVRPRLSAQGVSGIGTLISGSYLEVQPGDGRPERRFTALEDPPVVSADVAGSEYVVHARRLGSVSQGSPVFYRGVEVGEVLGYTLSDQDGSATLRVFVRKPHDALVHEGTRFWNASGIAVSLGSDGVRLHTESLEALLAGGVAFDVPPGGEDGALAQAGTAFDLYADQDAARAALYTRRISFMLHLPGSAQGLSIGAPVRMRGIQVGEVIDVHMDYDANTRQVTVPVTFDLEPQRVRILHRDLSEVGFAQRSYATFREFVARGLRARLASGNLITGQKLISLDFVDGAPAASLIEGGPYPEIPVTGTDDFDAILQSAQQTLTAVGGTVAALNRVIISPEVTKSLRLLQRSLANIDQLTRAANLQAGPLLANLRTASKSADQTLKQATATLATTGDAFASDGRGGDLAGMLTELKEAARSMRALADYLEDHPGSLIRGKGAKAN